MEDRWMSALVLDTSVLLCDPASVTKFPGQQVIIFRSVLEEIDSLKRAAGEMGKQARSALCFLDQLCRTGSLLEGISLENGSTIKLLKHEATAAVDLPIISAALWLKGQNRRVVFISKDFIAKMQAEAAGLEVQSYQRVEASCYTATDLQTVQITKHDFDLFCKDRTLAVKRDYRPNEYLILEAPGAEGLAKYNRERGALEPLLKPKNMWGIEPRNIEQRCAVDLLLRDEIQLVSLIGAAGTGKTLLALACGLRKVFDEGVYSRILISRPIIPLGRDIGFLPGTKEEKLSHWMQPIYDNLEFLCGSVGHEANETLRWVLDSKKVEMEAVTYIRGRSIPKQYFIIDEAQNLTLHEIKTVLSRAGEGTKIVLTGDPTQIDHPYLDRDSNGLSHVMGHFSSHSIYGNMFLQTTERSLLARLAIEM